MHISLGAQLQEAVQQNKMLIEKLRAMTDLMKENEDLRKEKKNFFHELGASHNSAGSNNSNAAKSEGEDRGLGASDLEIMRRRLEEESQSKENLFAKIKKLESLVEAAKEISKLKDEQVRKCETLEREKKDLCDKLEAFKSENNERAISLERLKSEVSRFKEQNRKAVVKVAEAQKEREQVQKLFEAAEKLKLDAELKSDEFVKELNVQKGKADESLKELAAVAAELEAEKKENEILKNRIGEVQKVLEVRNSYKSGKLFYSAFFLGTAGIVAAATWYMGIQS